MAHAFQNMLLRFGLAEKILSFNADNATSNDTQTTKLAALDNSFEEENRVRCFNHTIQLSAKELIKPFNPGMTTSNQACSDDDGTPLGDADDPRADTDTDEDEEDAEDDVDDVDDIDNLIDEIDMLSEEEREEIVADTAVVRETVVKVTLICLP
jgi:hypothetical protein